MRTFIISSAAAVALAAPQGEKASLQGSIMAQKNMKATKASRWAERYAAGEMPVKGLETVSEKIACEGGIVVSGEAEYPCKAMDMLAFMSLEELGSQEANTEQGPAIAGSDVWGWTSPEGDNIAIIGQNDGTAFARINADGSMTYLGRTQTANNEASIWRDIKVRNDHAFIGAEASRHGVQAVDLREVAKRTSDEGPIDPVSTFDSDGVTSTHNIVANTDEGAPDHIFVVGGNGAAGGIQVIDISNPAEMKLVGQYADDGYTHDAQCVMYNGDNEKYQGHEICYCYNEDTLTIISITALLNGEEAQISRLGYDKAHYTHQGWLTADRSRVLLDDELDEMEENYANTRTLIFNVEDIENPVYETDYLSPTKSIDHNLYTFVDDDNTEYAYLSNYMSGIRLVDITGIADGDVNEVAFFDVDPSGDENEFAGVWSSYYFPNTKHFVVNSIERGTFVVNHNKDAPEEPEPEEPEPEEPEPEEPEPEEPEPEEPEEPETPNKPPYCEWFPELDGCQ